MLKMSSINSNSNSPFQDFTDPEDHTPLWYITPTFKPVNTVCFPDFSQVVLNSQIVSHLAKFQMAVTTLVMASTILSPEWSLIMSINSSEMQVRN